MLTTELKHLEKNFSGNKGNCAKHMKTEIPPSFGYGFIKLQNSHIYLTQTRQY